MRSVFRNPKETWGFWLKVVLRTRVKLGAQEVGNKRWDPLVKYGESLHVGRIITRRNECPS